MAGVTTRAGRVPVAVSTMPLFSMLPILASRWWMLLIRGIVAILFGLAAFFVPGLTLLVLIWLFGAYFILDGISAISIGGWAHSWWLLIAGVPGIIAGILAFLYPCVTGFWLLILFASWLIVRGIFEILAAIRLRKEISGEWLLILGGIISIVFGGLLLFNPLAGALAMVWLIGIYAFLFGIVISILAFRLRRLRAR